jgi:hypothetical protein
VADVYERPMSAKDSPASREIGRRAFPDQRGVTAMRWCSTTSCASRSLVYTPEVRTI